MSRIIQLFRIRFPKWAFSWVVLGSDVLAGASAYYLSLYPQLASISHPVGLFLLIQFLWSVLFLLVNLYKGEFTISRIHEVKIFLQTTFIVVVLIVFMDAVRLFHLPFEPRVMIKYWMGFSVLAIPFRLIIRGYQKFLLRQGIGRERALIVGYNERGVRTALDLDRHHQQGYDVVGFIQADDEPNGNFDSPFPLLGGENVVQEVIQQHRVTDVVLALTNPEHTRIMSAITKINGAPVTIKILPDIYEVISGLARTQQIAGLPLVDLDLNLHTVYVRYIKRILDLVLGLPLLILSLPVWAVVAMIIRIDSKGPILYRQERIGQHGKPFIIKKFRSMHENAEQHTGPVWAGENDGRITSAGKWLRRFRLDEIPQLLNVLTGEMSLVGPRPERPYFVEKLKAEFMFYHRRLNVKPGVSGWAQIKHPYDQDLEDVRQKLRFDFYYIENISFALDMKILASTAWVMFSGEGR